MEGPRKFRSRPVVVEAVQLMPSIIDFLWVYAWVQDTRRLFKWSDCVWGDWVVRGSDGHYHLMKENAFETAYEPVD